jgi:ABC-type antimicrobial peptide transport system permease subunit
VIISVAIIFGLSMTTISVNIPWELNPYPHFLVASPDLAATVQTYPFPITFQINYALIALGIVLIIGILTAAILTKKINNLKVMEVIRNE